MALRYFITLVIAVSWSFLIAQNGYEIKVKVEGYESSRLILGYQYGTKQYIKDTVVINDQNEFVFKGEEPLDEGLYLLVMEPDNNFVQFMKSHYFSTFCPYHNLAISGKCIYIRISGRQVNKVFLGSSGW